MTLETLTLEDLDRFPTVNAMLDELYGEEGTFTREAFDKEAYAYYHQIVDETDNEEMKQVKAQDILVAKEG